MRAKNIFLKRIGALALAAGVVLGTLAVNAQPASAATGFKVADKKYQKIYTMDDGTVYFEAKGTFPVITDQSKAAKKINQELLKVKNQWIRETRKEAADAKQVSLPSLNASDEINYEITANDGKYFSVLMSRYEYEGGAHGMPYRITSTFDAKTGEQLSAAKVLGTTKAKMNAKVRKLYLNKYDKMGPDAGFYDELIQGKSNRDALKETLEKLDFNNAFYVKNGKVVFYVYPYVLGPYSAGFIEVFANVK